MEFNDFLKLLRRKTQTIVAILLVVTMMAILVSLTQPLKYGVSSRLLVTQNSDNTDAYSLSRSNEYLGNLLATVVYSGSFYDKVLNSKYNVDKNYFAGEYSKQLKRWNKTVLTKTKQDTGIIEINIYHTKVAEARKIALAVNDILINSNQDYHGGKNVEISIIDQPLASSYPVKPNLLVNSAMAFIVAFLFSLFYIYVFPEDKYSLYLFGKKNVKNKKRKKVKSNLGEISIKSDLEYEEIPNLQENIDTEEELKGNISNIIR
ncbi:MAG: hypothetical protein PHH52_01945 [Patescibacteria group bacterium]|nr:hypothetical protein [Patescibacteria group bacterium]MDD3778123.1 hypothetical protein [Patescibacteria group bacterium]MDD3939636.1 hypothetical protein [Patescibacteria group bacterium]MDD4443784.1 hypothetical protein [Patescibacteria group bacterium]NCU39606.1 hypothetical protein [Candidatus Falkowbacteria bacterium]